MRAANSPFREPSAAFSLARTVPVSASSAISTSVSARSSPAAMPRRMTSRMASCRGPTTVSLYRCISRGYFWPSPSSSAYRRAFLGSARSSHITVICATKSSLTLPVGSGNGDFIELSAASSSSSLFGQRR